MRSVRQGNQVSLQLKEIGLVDKLKDKEKIAFHVFGHAEYSKSLLVCMLERHVHH